MKLTTLLLITAILQVSASTFAQKITLSEKNVPIQKVFNQIRIQTSYDFIFSDDVLKDINPISIQVKDADLKSVLTQIFQGQPLEYSIEDKSIVVSKKEQSLFDKIKTALQIPITVSGKVTDTAGTPLIGATIINKSGGKPTVTNEKGEFSLEAQNDDKVIISYIGYKSYVFTVTSSLSYQNIVLHPSFSKLSEVVVNTGYQTIPQERATGSFVQVDNALINRSVSTDILSRLKDVTSGLVFNLGRTGGSNPISIRGQNTIYGNAKPLIVIDNFPYEGDITNINPNDVENITVLKDAAAASIWGARAGNGVIVITTKKGRFNQAPKISFNTVVNVVNKPNIYYHPTMSSSDFIELEKTLYNQGYYTALENSLYSVPITPVAELLIAARDGKITQAQALQQADQLKSYDVRKDIDKYIYQKAINQQYGFNLSGGSTVQKYNISAGYDHNRDNLVDNGYNRLTLNANNTYAFLNGKLEATTGIYYTESNTTTNNAGMSSIGLYSGNGGSLYPYARLADDQDNPLAITHDYRASFVQQAQALGFLNWQYKPLQEIALADNTNKVTDYRLNASLGYHIFDGLRADVLYQYNKTITNGRNLHSQDSYFTRDLINNYTQVSTTNTLSYPIPLGAILDYTNGTVTANNIRGQLNYAKTFSNVNSINAIAGYELRDYHTLINGDRSYGYDTEHGTAKGVDYASFFNQYYFPGYATNIPYVDNSSNLTDRYVSWYANAAYTYDSRYTVSASTRLDRSNLFGVQANQQGVPLYSAGLGWDISKEQFYKVDYLPYLKLRVTYGYNGNVNKSLSAYTTAQLLSGNLVNQNYAIIRNPANPDLKWERVQLLNFALDFSTRNNSLTGSIEYYLKKGKDLIGDVPFAPSTGVTTFRGNTAATSGQGLDLTINSLNINQGVKWNTNFLFSYAADKVTNYQYSQVASYYTQFSDSQIYPLSGKPYYGLYSYKWAGLDPQTGDPQGYLNGKVSKDYAAILAAATPGNLVYEGSARPTVFGSVRNTVSWRTLSLSFNISYRFNYYFRKPGIFYSDVLSGQGYYWGNYSNRWQKPGDELITNIPSMPSVNNSSRDSFFNYSETLVDKGDNIRLQDITLSYDLSKKQWPRLPFNSRLYIYANNIGILWKATKSDLDPDYAGLSYLPPSRSIAFGLKIDL